MRPARAQHQDDRGQATPIVLGLMAVAVVVLLALVPLAVAAQQRAAARSAADAAALAGAAEGEGAARAVAEANGAELVGWRASGVDVWVVVTLGDARAEAKARRDR
ncbi:MAG: pilus assembly protein TadG-related protein [Acidimicrobiales bacterium]